MIYSADELGEIIGISGAGVRFLAAKYGRGKRFGRRVMVFSDSDLEWFKTRPKCGRQKKAPG